MTTTKYKVYVRPVALTVGAYPGFCAMKRQRLFLLPLDGMLVHRRLTPSIKFAGSHLTAWVEWHYESVSVLPKNTKQ